MMTREMINTNNGAVNFANSFGREEFLDHLLANIPNKAKIRNIFTNPKYNTKVLSYGNIRQNMDTILTDVFEEYIAETTEMRKAGDPGTTEDRINIFKGILADRLELKDVTNDDSTGQKLMDDLAGFCRTSEGKKIDNLLTKAGVKDDKKDTLRMDIVTWLAARSFVISEMMEPEHVEGEVITGGDNDSYNTSHSAHQSVSMKNESGDEDLVTKDATFIATTMVNTLKLVQASNYDVDRVVSILEPQINSIVTEFKGFLERMEFDEIEFITTNEFNHVVGNSFENYGYLKSVTDFNAIKLMGVVFSAFDADRNDTSDVFIYVTMYYLLLDVMMDTNHETVTKLVGYVCGLLKDYKSKTFTMIHDAKAARARSLWKNFNKSSRTNTTSRSTTRTSRTTSTTHTTSVTPVTPRNTTTHTTSVTPVTPRNTTTHTTSVTPVTPRNTTTHTTSVTPVTPRNTTTHTTSVTPVTPRNTTTHTTSVTPVTVDTPSESFPISQFLNVLKERDSRNPQRVKPAKRVHCPY